MATGAFVDGDSILVCALDPAYGASTWDIFGAIIKLSRFAVKLGFALFREDYNFRAPRITISGLGAFDIESLLSTSMA